MLNQVFGSPVLFFFILLPCCLLAAKLLQISAPVASLYRPLKWLAIGILGVAVLGHAYFAVTYLIYPGFTDHIEPNTAVVAWLYANGSQIYHPIDAAERYSFLYGPLAYMATGFLYQLFGASTLIAKLAGILCLALTMVWLVLATRRRFPDHWYPCVIALGYFSLLALFFKHHSFWSKPDPFMIAAVSLGLFSCLMVNRRYGWLILGLSLGLAVNAKITGGIYFLPLLAWLYTRDGFRSILISGLVALLVAGLPFLSPSSVSLSNYVGWLQAAGGHGLSRSLLQINAMFLFFICIPLIAFLLWQNRASALVSWFRGNKLVAGISVIAVLLVLIAASKPGSGPHHFLPFLPILAFLTACAVVKVKQTDVADNSAAYYFWSPLSAVFIAASVKTAVALYYGLRVISSQVMVEEVIQEIYTLESRYPDSNIYMGYGDGSRYTSTFARNNLVYAGEPYLLDPSALMDFQMSGMEIPQATIDRMLSDGAAVWLIPAGQEPFSLINWYHRFSGGLLFSDEFRSAFVKNFSKQASTPHFDIYIAIANFDADADADKSIDQTGI